MLFATSYLTDLHTVYKALISTMLRPFRLPLHIVFFQEWYDSRISHNGTGPIIIRDKSVFDKLWRPDLYFANARSAGFQEITEDNFLVWVYPDGKVWYDCRISLVAICTMDLW